MPFGKTELKNWLLILPIVFSSNLVLASDVKLLREPDLSGDTLVFTYARDIWKTSLGGGEATRITSFQGQEMHPSISPDGQWVAFTGDYEGNQDVYVTAITGGVPKRLTFHPVADSVVGWSSNGKSVLFSSGRSNAPRGQSQLFTISVDGGIPKQLPMNRALDGAFSADGQQMVYRRAELWDAGWRNYRGGQNQPLRLIRFSDLSERDLPWNNSLDLEPQWQGEYIYFLSNRSQVANVYRVSENGGTIEQLTNHDDFDVKGFSIDDDQLVYEYQGGLFHKPLDSDATPISINLNADFPWSRPHWEDVSEKIESANLSPKGKRAVFVARGDVFTVPVEHGDARNLTDSSGSREVAASWSNDGQRIGWFSDASGEYRLIISNQFGKPQKEIQLAESGFYGELQWSPDDQYLVFSDQRQQLWLADLENDSVKVFAEQPVTNFDWGMAPSWSPDSRYIAYAIQSESFFRSLTIYGVQDGKSRKMTEGMADVRFPVWDQSGDKLYFAASTDYGPKASWLDLTSVAFTPSYGIYYLLLNDEVKSPLLPRSDDEELADGEDAAADEEGEDEKSVPEVVIGFDKVHQRMLPLGESGRISELKTGKPGELFYLKVLDEKTSLYRYSLEDREATLLASDVVQYRVSGDGEQILVQSKKKWQMFSSSEPLGEEAKTLNTALAKLVDNDAEWQQIFREAWRFQRDYFYVANLHGADWSAIYEAYQPLVQYVKHPADMTYLLDNLGAETSIGHSFTADGDLPDIGATKVGLLGADLETTVDGYRFTRIFRGESWYPEEQEKAPLGKLAGRVQEGDYLIAIDGKPLSPNSNIYESLRGTVGKQTVLTVSRDGKTTNANDFTVVPVDSESKLRRNAWVEDNRKRVDEASDGKLAYVWVPNTAEQGFAYFNRYFFAQIRRQGVIVDERFNHGGFIADYIIDVLRREQHGYFNNQMQPDRPMTAPANAIWGPKVMLINEMSGSGGDMLPYMFRFHDIGPLVGKRTWGGLVGIWGVPELVDGGYITAPRSGFYNIDGEWAVENEGVEPDIEVDQWTKDTINGKDAQLEKAIEVALEILESNPRQFKVQPEDPVRVPRVVQPM